MTGSSASSRLRSDAWLNDHKSIGYHETSALLTQLKQTPEHAWLNEVSSVPVQQALQHLQNAFNNFCAKRAKYPTFKSKHGKQSASYVASGFQWDGKEDLKLAKMDAPLKIRWSQPIPKGAKVTTCAAVRNERKVAAKIGIDLGLTHFAILSTGEKIGSPRTFRKHEGNLVKLQRRLAKKKLGSKNRAKAKLKVARLHARIADARKDFLHKLSTRF